MENTKGYPAVCGMRTSSNVPDSKIMEDNNDISLRGLNLLGEDSGACNEGGGGADGRKFL